ncbi:DUF3515 domain-containing protein [Gordonia insulae]|uniref:DUF3515 domain-containing protein n=1 Tax=Gordonia insulae TaxID=2420509 RepID=UPI000F5BD9B6
MTDDKNTDGAPEDPRPADQQPETVADELESRYGTGPRLSPALIATLVTIPVIVIVGFITFAALRPEEKSPIESYTVAESASPECAKLVAEVPQTFEGFGDKQVNGSTVTWPADGDGEAVTLRCGISRPSELSPTSNLQVIHPVQWFITDTVEGSGQAYVCVDHRPYVAMWIPANAGNGPITDVSAVIERTLPRGPLDFG